MTSENETRQPAGGKPEELPFVAPCRDLHPLAAFGWLRRGWRDGHPFLTHRTGEQPGFFLPVKGVAVFEPPFKLVAIAAL